MRWLFLSFLFLFSPHSKAFQNKMLDKDDQVTKNSVEQLNRKAYEARLTNPEQTISIARQAHRIASEIRFESGTAEANRVLGIGFSYINERDSALNRYLTSLRIFKEIKDELGEAKVSSNIGNLWIDIDYDKALNYYQKTLEIAEKYQMPEMIAGAHLNIGNSFYRKKQYFVGLENYRKSSNMFTQIGNPIGITQSLQNMGVMYYKTGDVNEAEKLLLQAYHKAKEHELNNSVASINMTLSSIYIQKGVFATAEKYIQEGIAYAKLVNDEKKIYDYTYTYYELEAKRKNYEKALSYLKEVNMIDSVNYKKNTSLNINLIQQTLKQQQTQKENELTIQAQRNAKKLSFAIGSVALLAFFVIFLLFKSNQRSKTSNLKLTSLNEEVLRQKANVDRINHQLEELIAERTKDLIIKNQKLSEYSSHLSHQIRGPVATLKGLMILIEDKLVESDEVAPQIKKCVDDIDNRIMGINEALHDSSKSGLS